MTHDDGLEALLAEHQWDITRNTPHCNCGELAYSITTHQAAVVRAAGWRKGREEWGTKRPNGYVTEHVSQDSARWYAAVPEVGRVTVHRYGATNWEEA